MGHVSVSRAGDIIEMITAVRIAKLAAMADALSVPDGGFSVDPRTGADVSQGYAVSVHPECERVFDGEVTADDLFVYLVEMADTVSQVGRMLGGWRDPATGRAFLDVSAVVDSQSAALDLAREHRQLAIFDLTGCASIPAA
jgi:hypothetical protein